MTSRYDGTRAARRSVLSTLMCLPGVILASSILSSSCGDTIGVGIRTTPNHIGSSGPGNDASSGVGPDGALLSGSCAAGCYGATPVCNAAVNQCVECLVDAHCAGTGKGHCDVATHRCTECLGSTDCPSGFVCDLARGVCALTCATSADCGGQVCDVAHGHCVQCVSSSDCSSTDDHFCNVDLGKCAECISDAQCPGGACDPVRGCVQCSGLLPCAVGRVCDLATGTCLPTCTDDRQCPGETPFCDASLGLCVQCLTSTNCTEGSTPVCSPVTHRCYACLSDGDCKDPQVPVCLVREHRCAQCAQDSDCPVGTRCDVGTAHCE